MWILNGIVCPSYEVGSAKWCVMSFQVSLPKTTEPYKSSQGITASSVLNASTKTSFVAAKKCLSVRKRCRKYINAKAGSTNTYTEGFETAESPSRSPTSTIERFSRYAQSERSRNQNPGTSPITHRPLP